MTIYTTSKQCLGSSEDLPSDPTFMARAKTMALTSACCIQIMRSRFWRVRLFRFYDTSPDSACHGAFRQQVYQLDQDDSYPLAAAHHQLLKHDIALAPGTRRRYECERHSLKLIHPAKPEPRAMHRGPYPSARPRVRTHSHTSNERPFQAQEHVYN